MNKTTNTLTLPATRQRELTPGLRFINEARRRGHRLLSRRHLSCVPAYIIMECCLFFFSSILVSNFVKAEIFSEKISPAANISTGNRRENDRDECEKKQNTPSGFITISL